MLNPNKVLLLLLNLALFFFAFKFFVESHEQIHSDIFTEYGCKPVKITTGLISGHTECKGTYTDINSKRTASFLHILNEITALLIIMFLIGLIALIITIIER